MLPDLQLRIFTASPPAPHPHADRPPLSEPETYVSPHFLIFSPLLAANLHAASPLLFDTTHSTAHFCSSVDTHSVHLLTDCTQTNYHRQDTTCQTGLLGCVVRTFSSSLIASNSLLPAIKRSQEVRNLYANSSFLFHILHQA